MVCDGCQEEKKCIMLVLPMIELVVCDECRTKATIDLKL